MQPQAQSPAPAPTPAPGSNSNPEFNFIFNGDSQPKKRFSLPGGNSLTKIVALVVISGAVLGILIIVLSNILGPKGIDKKQTIDIIARAQEISRVSNDIVKDATDVNTANIASTTSATLTSDQEQIIALLKKNKIKVPTKEITVYRSKTTDSQIQTAIQNNRLSEYYYAYLKKNLTEYQSALKTTSDATSSNKLKTLLIESQKSTTLILSTRQLASATAP